MSVTSVLGVLRTVSTPTCSQMAGVRVHRANSLHRPLGLARLSAASKVLKAEKRGALRGGHSAPSHTSKA